MSRALLVLVSVMMVSAAFAGCFGSDDDGDDGDDMDNGNGMDNGNMTADNNTTANGGGNNTTSPPKVLIPPTPAFTVSLQVFDEEGAEVSNETGINFTVTPGTNVTLWFDGSASSDEDGEIQAFSWQAMGPDEREFKNAGAVLEAPIGEMRSGTFGLYKATLKVLDSDNVLNSVEFFIPLDYSNQFSQPTGMDGVGNFACEDEDEAGNALPAGDITPGTYVAHKLTLSDNASAVSLTLTYTGTASQLGIRLLPPDAGEDGCDQAIGTAEPGASPLTLTVTEALTAGQHIVRVDMDGVSVDSYTLDVSVTYEAPSLADGGADDESGAGENGEGA